MSAPHNDHEPPGYRTWAEAVHRTGGGTVDAAGLWNGIAALLLKATHSGHRRGLRTTHVDQCGLTSGSRQDCANARDARNAAPADTPTGTHSDQAGTQ